MVFIMEKKYLQLNDVPAYKIAFNLSNLGELQKVPKEINHQINLTNERLTI